MVDCKICEHPLCSYAGVQRGIVVECANYMPRQKPQTNAEVVREWIPVTERLPKEEGYYLVAHQRSGCVAERFYYRDCPDLFVEVTGDPVTHWMPLPEPPKGE